jgi:hypothetical protein
VTADPIQRLLDIEEIQQLMGRYCRCLDLKLWDELGETFSEDVAFDIPATGVKLAGRKAVVELLRGVLPKAVTVHHAHMPEIEVDGDTACGVWAICDMVDRTGEGGSIKRGYSHCREQYVRVDGSWRIKRFDLTFLRIDQGAQP